MPATTAAAVIFASAMLPFSVVVSPFTTRTLVRMPDGSDRVGVVQGARVAGDERGEDRDGDARPDDDRRPAAGGEDDEKRNGCRQDHEQPRMAGIGGRAE